MLAIPQTCSGTTLSTGTVSWCLLGMRTQQAPSHSRFHTEINPFSDPSRVRAHEGRRSAMEHGTLGTLAAEWGLPIRAACTPSRRAPRAVPCTHTTHSGSSLSSSSLRGDDLHTVDTTEQVPGVGGGAPRCYPQTPSPTPGNSWHGSDAGSNTTQSPGWPLQRLKTHSRARAGGWVAA